MIFFFFLVTSRPRNIATTHVKGNFLIVPHYGQMILSKAEWPLNRSWSETMFRNKYFPLQLFESTSSSTLSSSIIERSSNTFALSSSSRDVF